MNKESSRQDTETIEFFLEQSLVSAGSGVSESHSGVAGSSGMKSLKIWSNNRKTKKGVIAGTFNEMKNKCFQKFNLLPLADVKFVLECGTEVDEEFYQTLQNGTILILIQDNEELEDNNASKKEKSSCNQGEKLESKKKANRSRQSVSFCCGWLHYNFVQGKYIQVRSGRSESSTGGTVSLTFPVNAQYHIVLDRLANHFFPHGESCKGKLKDFDYHLATSKQDQIVRSGFTAGTHYDKYASGGRARIYLMTKRKFFQFSFLGALNSSDDSDMDIPPPWKRLRRPVTQTQTAENLFDLDDVFQSDSTSQPVTQINACLSADAFTISQPLTYVNAGTPTRRHVTQTQTAENLFDLDDVFQSDSTSQPVTQINACLSADAFTISQPLTYVNAGTPTVSFKQANNTLQSLTTTANETLEHQLNRNMQVTKQQNSEATKSCCVCMDRPQESFFMPCGHLFCMVCAVQIESSTRICPCCRKKVFQVGSLQV